MYGNANNSSRVFEIQQSISSLKQEQDQSFLEHFGAFKQKCEELHQYRPIAATVVEYIKREQQDQIFYLLASLTSDYEEAHFSSSKTVDNNKWTKGKDKKGAWFFCDHCNRSGHSKERCYVLHPQLKPSRNRSNEANLAANSENDGIQHKLEHITKQIDFLMKKCTTDNESAHADPIGESHVAQHTENQGEITAYKDFQIVAIPVDHQYGPSQIKNSQNELLVEDISNFSATRDRPSIANGTDSTYEDPNPMHEDENTPSRPESGGSPMADSNRPENEEVQVHAGTSLVRRSTRVTKQPAKS
ncbi:uncharacterized protein A4U43_C01F17500 [Asparagus officinalis]|uniref:Retrotransposon gag domain-containing protein n=1 Tax=Asparagus officinalis TaxID=4686 RepID=A0A5P1FQ31_ASPOF|nr:uncharacterized protein A4U43_C01F17500 [Asparagus officinalis]